MSQMPDIDYIEPAEVKPWQCHMCLETFPVQRAVEKHLNEVHYKRDTPVCETCGKTFTSSYNVLKHMKYSHRKQCLVCSRKSPCPEHEEFKCEFCLKVFKREYTWSTHIRKVHNLYLCQACSSSFDCQEELVQHVTDIHSNNYKKSEETQAS